MYVKIFLLFLHPACLHLILFLHPRSSCGGSCVAFGADARAPPAAVPTNSPGGDAREDPCRRLLCGLPLAAPCLAVAPARICAATRWRCLRGPPPGELLDDDGATGRGAMQATRRRIPAAGSSPVFQGHGEPHKHHGHDEPVRR
jgi:hypothetical protein